MPRPNSHSSPVSRASTHTSIDQAASTVTTESTVVANPMRRVTRFDAAMAIAASADTMTSTETTRVGSGIGTSAAFHTRVQSDAVTPDFTQDFMQDATHEFTQDLALALSLADVADRLTMARFGADNLRVETKADLTPVSEADQAAEAELRARLARERPADGILGEEYGTTGDTVRQWILDPIDGTKNYVRGVPVWSTLIALLVAGEPVVGVVSAPALGRRWWAAIGGGAWTTRPGAAAPARIRVSAVRDLADASFSYSEARGWADAGAGDGLRRLLDDTWRQRAYGDFWSHMLVAEGAVDIAAEPQLAAYDMAALIPIVVEAGGMITGYDGRPALECGQAVTTNGHLHPTVLALLSGR